MKFIKYLLIFSITLLQSISHVYSKSLIITGNDRLSNDDIQTLTSIDIFSENLNDDSLNTIVKDLYKSELIDSINFTEKDGFYKINISETKVINEIYFNGNLRVKDELLKSSLNTQPGNIFQKSLNLQIRIPQLKGRSLNIKDKI